MILHAFFSFINKTDCNIVECGSIYIMFLFKIPCICNKCTLFDLVLINFDIITKFSQY